MFFLLYTPMLTALNKIFTPYPPLLKAILGVLFSHFCSVFPYFLKTVWFLMKFCTYILDDTMMVLRQRILIGGIALCLGLFWVLGAFLGGGRKWGGGGIFLVFFSITWKGFICFLQFLQRYFRYYSGNHRKNNVVCLQDYFRVI